MTREDAERVVELLDALIDLKIQDAIRENEDPGDMGNALDIRVRREALVEMLTDREIA
jgi:hypothetical protein